MVFALYVGFKCILVLNNLQCDHCFPDGWKSHSNSAQPLNICSDFYFPPPSFSTITILLLTQNLLHVLGLWPCLYWEMKDNLTKDVKTTHRSPDYQKGSDLVHLSLWFPAKCGFNSETCFDLMHLSSHSCTCAVPEQIKAKCWPSSFSVFLFSPRSPCSAFTTGVCQDLECCTVVPVLNY